MVSLLPLPLLFLFLSSLLPSSTRGYYEIALIADDHLDNPSFFDAYKVGRLKDFKRHYLE